jgi:hypothetical protein
VDAKVWIWTHLREVREQWAAKVTRNASMSAAAGCPEKRICNEASGAVDHLLTNAVADWNSCSDSSTRSRALKLDETDIGAARSRVSEYRAKVSRVWSRPTCSSASLSMFETRRYCMWENARTRLEIARIWRSRLGGRDEIDNYLRPGYRVRCDSIDNLESDASTPNVTLDIFGPRNNRKAEPSRVGGVQYRV